MCVWVRTNRMFVRKLPSASHSHPPPLQFPLIWFDLVGSTQPDRSIFAHTFNPTIETFPPSLSEHIRNISEHIRT